MKVSTRNLVKLHGWRIDRFVHNYLYFAFYRPYVRAAMVLVRLSRRFPLVQTPWRSGPDGFRPLPQQGAFGRRRPKDPAS